MQVSWWIWWRALRKWYIKHKVRYQIIKHLLVDAQMSFSLCLYGIKIAVCLLILGKWDNSLITFQLQLYNVCREIIKLVWCVKHFLLWIPCLIIKDSLPIWSPVGVHVISWTYWGLWVFRIIFFSRHRRMRYQRPMQKWCHLHKHNWWIPVFMRKWIRWEILRTRYLSLIVQICIEK